MPKIYQDREDSIYCDGNTICHCLTNQTDGILQRGVFGFKCIKFGCIPLEVSKNLRILRCKECLETFGGMEGK